MRSPPSHCAVSTNNNSISKCKKRYDCTKRPTTTSKNPMPILFKPDKPRSEPAASKNGSKPVLCDKFSSPKMKVNNQLLAGYMAHEFLTKGTLLGQRYGRLPSPSPEPMQNKYQRYTELTQLLKTPGGPQLPGIVNPTQLAQFLGLSSSKEGKTLI